MGAAVLIPSLGPGRKWVGVQCQVPATLSNGIHVGPVWMDTKKKISLAYAEFRMLDVPAGIQLIADTPN